MAPPVTPVSKPIKTLDLKALTTGRKPPRIPRFSSQKPNRVPLPRHLQRVNSAPSLPEVITMSLSATHANAVASSSKVDETSPRSVSASGAPSQLPRPLKLMLPRLRDLRKMAQSTVPQIPRSPLIPSASNPSVFSPAGQRAPSPATPFPPSATGAGAPSQNVGDAGPSRSIRALNLVPREATPPRSSSPEDMEEEECLSLVYPDSAEVSPEVEVRDASLFYSQ